MRDVCNYVSTITIKRNIHFLDSWKLCPFFFLLSFFFYSFVFCLGGGGGCCAHFLRRELSTRNLFTRKTTSSRKCWGSFAMHACTSSTKRTTWQKLAPRDEKNMLTLRNLNKLFLTNKKYTSKKYALKIADKRKRISVLPENFCIFWI